VLRAVPRVSATSRRFAASVAQPKSGGKGSKESNFSRYAGMAFFGAMVRAEKTEGGGSRIKQLLTALLYDNWALQTVTTAYLGTWQVWAGVCTKGCWLV
jgi:hypothetical protein